MSKPGHKGIRRLIAATRYSAKGLQAAWKHESAFRQESLLGLIMLPLALLLGETVAQRAVLIGVCFLVLIVELLNSAIEAAVDRIGTEHHELAGRAKDMGSAAVSLSLLLVWLTWGLVIVHRLF